MCDCVMFEHTAQEEQHVDDAEIDRISFHNDLRLSQLAI